MGITVDIGQLTDNPVGSAGTRRPSSTVLPMGGYTGDQPTGVMTDELARFLDWKLGMHGLDPHGERRC